MSLFVIGDLHLSFGSGKPMDIFEGWSNHITKLKKNWEDNIRENDTVVIVGDISWAINFDELYEDFLFLDKLPGYKIILKGNHDYWFTTKTKVDNYIKDNNFSSIKVLFNNSYVYDEYTLCGTRGWINENKNDSNDQKILLRECGRLEQSLRYISDDNKTPIVFLHYPPVYFNFKSDHMINILKKYGVKRVYYGHLHGHSCQHAVNDVIDDIEYKLISSDFLQFNPLKII